jgi:hypothetical protein
MSQVTNLAFFRARRGKSEALGAALAALVEPSRIAQCLRKQSAFGIISRHPRRRSCNIAGARGGRYGAEC